jgi:hypothetical protein
MFETIVYISCACHFGSKETEKANEYIFVHADERVERTMARGICI